MLSNDLTYFTTGEKKEDKKLQTVAHLLSVGQKQNKKGSLHFVADKQSALQQTCTHPAIMKMQQQNLTTQKLVSYQ